MRMRDVSEGPLVHTRSFERDAWSIRLSYMPIIPVAAGMLVHTPAYIPIIPHTDDEVMGIRTLAQKLRAESLALYQLS